MALQDLDPEVAAVLGGFDLTLTRDTLGQYRQPIPSAAPPDRVERTDHVLPGEPRLPVRVYRAVDAEGPSPAVLSIHGGGYVLGDVGMDDAKLDSWSAELGITAVSVGYRLAPETPYPGALEDCYRALRWMHDQAGPLRIDHNRIGVSGVSAGGGLAAALALLARDRGEPPVAFQLLDCPMLDDRQRTPSSRLDGLPVWTRQSNEFGWRSYLGDLHGTDGVPSTAAPARCDDLSGLPPSFVSVGTVDGFRDEDVEYALRLNQAGVPCELHLYPGLPHGYHLAAGAPAVRRANRDAIEWLERQVRDR